MDLPGFGTRTNRDDDYRIDSYVAFLDAFTRSAAERVAGEREAVQPELARTRREAT